MNRIFETKNFIVEAFEKPHVTRSDGGHIKIFPKKEILDRTELSSELAIEFMRLTMVVGEALKIGMTKRGVKIIRVNYQDMGNWAFKKSNNPYFHLHIYGRSQDAKFQPYKEAVQLPDRSTGFYEAFEPLNEEDIKEIKKQIELIFKKEEYQDSKWFFN